MVSTEQRFDEVDELAVNTIRTLSIDAIQKANSGHPGTPMALAPLAYVLWQRFLRFDPENPIWPNRDRFVLSAGHASMLLYAILHLAGVRAVDPDYEVEGRLSITLEDIERFRQLDSKAAGHPEYRWASGVEATTGPLGQGVATSVGMAVASKWLAATYNKPGFELFDFDTYVICGDGDMMEGVSHEAAAFAGHQQLDNLCWIYDNNHISIDGRTQITMNEDVGKRFEAYGWNVARIPDANDFNEITRALDAFKATVGRPTMIIVDSHIGYGSPHKQDTAAAHGEPLGDEEVRETKRFYGWPEDAQFLVPEEVPKRFAEGVGRPRVGAARPAGRSCWSSYEREHQSLERQIGAMQRRELPEGWDRDIPVVRRRPEGNRDAQGLQPGPERDRPEHPVAAQRLGGPHRLDLGAPRREDQRRRLPAREPRRAPASLRDPRARVGGRFRTGSRSSKLRSSWSTYLTFSDYARPAIRLSALMELPVIHIFTHDSIGLGEDGPTHQPVEQLASLRAIPGLTVIRPCDANEVAEAWRVAIDRTHGPVALVLTRQNVPVLDRSVYASAEGLRRGGYVLADAAEGDPERDPDRDRQRGRARGRGAREAGRRRDRLAGGEPALVPPVRAPGPGVSRRVLPPAVTARVSIEEASTLGLGPLRRARRGR